MPSLFEDDLFALLKGDDAIAALVRDSVANELRIYPVERPQDQKNLAAIVFTVISGIPEKDVSQGGTLDPGEQARTDLENVRTQIDVWAANHDDARALGILVRARLEAGNQSIRAVMNFRQSDVDQETHEHREILDFSLWHSPQ